MEIERAIIKNFDPMLTGSNISFLDINFKSVMTIVLGINGCGKSQLFKILSPIPVTSRYFNPNGFFEFHCNHLGDSYILKSMFDEKGKATYSFYNASQGEELNPGGKITIQKDLVEKHFNYTESLHNILIGKLRFTHMSTLQRKDLLLRVSDTDLTFALDLFDKATRAFRDTIGAYKHVKAKVDQLGAEVVSDDVLKATLRRKDEIIETINRLRTVLESKSTNGEDQMFNAIASEVENLNNTCEKALNNITKYLEENGKSAFDDEYVASIDKDINTFRDALAVYTNKYEDLSKKAEKINEVAMRLDSLEGDNAIENVDIRLQQLDAKRKAYNDVIFDNPFQGYGHLSMITTCETLSKELAEIKVGMDETIVVLSAKEAVEISDMRKAFDEEKGQLQEKLDKEEAFLRSIIVASQGNVTCEKCGHENLASEHSSKECIDNARASVAKLNLQMVELNKELDKFIKEKYENFVKLGRVVKEVRDLVSRNPLFEMIITKISEKGTYNPLEVVRNFTRYIAESSKHSTNVSNHSKLKDIEDQLKALTEYKELVALGVMDKATDIENELSMVIDAMGKVEADIANRKRFTDALSTYHDTQAKMYDATNRLHKCVVSQTEEFLNAEVRKMINELSAELIVTDEVIFNARNKSTILESANKEHFALDRKRQALKHLVDALSPKTGVIGEALRLVLETFAEDINDYVEQVWSYDLISKPYANEHKLDFKMPLCVKGKTIPDIAEGSEGQREIIDFAARLCVMDYMDLENYPLFMDEVGSNFDQCHKESLLKFTNELSMSDKYSNLLLISHFAAEYGSHVNADVIVLNPGNITVPTKYNEHVTIQ